MRSIYLIFLLPFVSFSTAEAQSVLGKPQYVKMLLWMGGEWKESHNISYTYDQHGRLTTKAYLNTTGDSTSKDDYVYDEHGHQLFHGFYYRSGNSWNLQIAERSTLEHDTIFTNRISYQFAERFGIGQWQPDAKFYYTYNQNGELTERINAAPLNGDWVDVTRIGVSYNGAGKPDTAVFQLNNNGIWVDDERMFNMQGTITEKFDLNAYTMQRYQSNQWNNLSKHEITGSNRNKFTKRYSWIDASWKEFSVFRDSVDAFGYTLLYEEFWRDSVGLKLNNRNLHQLIFNNNRLAEEIIFGWDPDSNTWLNNTKFIYSGGEVLTGNIEPVKNDWNILLFPNPASDFVTITGINNGVEFEIYNLLSEVVSTGILQQHKIDISVLPKGIYLLHINTESGTVIRKLIKQ